jgi:hypothetical protein
MFFLMDMDTALLLAADLGNADILLFLVTEGAYIGASDDVK